MPRPKVLVLDDDLTLADRVSYAFPWCAIEWFTNPTTAYQSSAYTRATLIVVDGDTVRRSGTSPLLVLTKLQADLKNVIVVSSRSADNPLVYPFFLKPFNIVAIRSTLRTSTGYQEELDRDIPPI